MKENIQHCFDNLDASDASDESSNLQSLDSYASSIPDSLSSLCCDDLEPVPVSEAHCAVLSDAANCEKSKNARESTIAHLENELLSVFDFAWLRQRCDGDKHLLSNVLRVFCEQGQTHLNAIQAIVRKQTNGSLSFHAVHFSFPEFLLCNPTNRSFCDRVSLRNLLRTSGHGYFITKRKRSS